MNSTQKVYSTLATATQPMTALQIATACQLGSEVVRNILCQARWAENVGKVQETDGRRRAILWRWNGQLLAGRKWANVRTCKTCRERTAFAKGECVRCYNYRRRHSVARPQRIAVLGSVQISAIVRPALRQKLQGIAEKQRVSVSEAVRRLIEAA